MFYLFKYAHKVLISIIVSNSMSAMDRKLSLLDLARVPLVKILADGKLKVKDRKRLMRTCHQLYFMACPDNLLQQTIPLNLFSTIVWPFSTLKIAVQSKNQACCMQILDAERTKIKKLKKTFAYKVARDKSFYKNRFYRLSINGLEFPIVSSYEFIFYEKYSDNTGNNIPLFEDKKKLIELFEKCGHHRIAQNYDQAQNICELRYGKVLAQNEDLSYPPNLLGHACLFGKVEMLREILGSCKNFNDLLMYSPHPASVLALAAEYHNPECFKLLYKTPWLKEHFRYYSRPANQPLNHLETFIFYIHDKKIIETLLKTGCYDINETMHVIDISTNKYDAIVSNKYFQGKTLLDIVLIEKDKLKDKPIFDIKKQMPISIRKQLDATYYEKIEQLLRKFGGKTAREIAAIHPFNVYLIEDIQKYIIYRLSLLQQHKSRLVCSQWKKTIDDNSLSENSQSYLMLLRNSKPHYTIFQNSIRVLLGAIYYKNHSMVDLILQNFSQKLIASGTYASYFIKDNLEYPCVYNYHQFIQDDITKKILTDYYCMPLSQDKKPAKNDICLLNAIAASFLNDTVELEKILYLILGQLSLQDNTSIVITDVDIKKTLLHASRIIADYDYAESMNVFINTFKHTDFFTKIFNNLILTSYVLKSPKVLKVLLSSGIDINKVDDQNQTIKDMILSKSKTHPDMQYALQVKHLLDTYGAKTYKELAASYGKKI